MAILVFPNREEADRGLESYVQQNSRAREELEKAVRESDATDDPWENAGKGLEFPLLIEMYSTEEGYGAIFSGMHGGSYEQSSIPELAEEVKNDLSGVIALTRYVEALGAKLVPVLYTVLGQRHLIHWEGKNGDESFSFGEMSMDMKDFVARLPPENRAELEHYIASNSLYERGLTEDERKEFEALFYCQETR